MLPDAKSVQISLINSITKMVTKPVMTNRGQNYVAFSWKDVDSLCDSLCVVEMLDELKKWKVVCWGKKNEIKILNLKPCTCYDFRIKNTNNEGKKDEGWTMFRGATLEGSYLSMHLTRALKFNKTALIRKIIHSRPLLLEVENKEMKTPLNQAIEKNDLPLVSLLITLGADVNNVSYYNKKSPLMNAVSLGFITIATLLVDKGSNIHLKDINGLNILHYAVDSDDIESVKFVLNQDLNVDCQDSMGWTPLLRAAILNCNDEIIQLLIENGASTTIVDKNNLDFETHRTLASKIYVTEQ